MSFNSPLFLLFLLIVVVINYLLPQRFRHLFLLISSFAFIGYYNIESLITVLVFSVFNFYIAKKIAGNRLLYIAGIIVNAYAIIMFNYFTATKEGFDFAYSMISFNINSFIIALGLSFYSLQNIAYLTEVYFNRLQPEQDISKYILYNSFFPKIISGPVMLPKEFIPQVNSHSITKEKLVSGFNRLLLGLFKKMVIADRLSPAVHSIFDFHDHYSGLTTLAGASLFTIQLYFDFSGYTDMALGIAKMLGYDLKENFNLPLRSTSVSEFWRRWHISLISWFTAYIYYPLAYKLRGYKKAAALAGIIVTFMISGIWHGIGFTFLAWAACHIFYLSYELFTKHFRVRLSSHVNAFFYKTLSVFLVFNAVSISNIFFRAGSFEKAVRLMKDTFSFHTFIPDHFFHDLIVPLAVGGHQLDEFNFYISIFITSVVLLFERKINYFAVSEKLNVFFITTIILLIFFFGIFNNGERFIYMQF